MGRWILPLAVVLAALVALVVALRPAVPPTSSIPGPADEALGDEGVEETGAPPRTVVRDEGRGDVNRNPEE
ncbi:MAG: hypothetical protein NZM40_02065 [Sphingomonadaceae bacterium]|uniref:hypothetical protein n=1 Tax=Thermaurantiacus sp. TaxID=2820283 RepID=UPI00298ED451|nr:hypothetical protein [Thermaurantiacus sp.]MCS6986218.1 hypothetical protein [Sphingomonadaceae bacterium]MDW8415875.1 hypothetical protein [Thermaurantiacus sp.]